jgi:hypothetical protein
MDPNKLKIPRVVGNQIKKKFQPQRKKHFGYTDNTVVHRRASQILFHQKALSIAVINFKYRLRNIYII